MTSKIVIYGIIPEISISRVPLKPSTDQQRPSTTYRDIRNHRHGCIHRHHIGSYCKICWGLDASSLYMSWRFHFCLSLCHTFSLPNLFCRGSKWFIFYSIEHSLKIFTALHMSRSFRVSLALERVLVGHTSLFVIHASANSTESRYFVVPRIKSFWTSPS